MPLPVFICLYFSHCSVRQYVNHDLGSQTKCVDKSLAIGEHVHLPLGGHVFLEQFLLLFSESVGQCVSSLHKVIQGICVLGVALDAALAGGAHPRGKDLPESASRHPSAVDELVKYDLFRPVTDAVHASHPLHLISGLERLGHAFLLGQLAGKQFHSPITGFVDLQ